jgi:hypothetical protein
LSDPDVFVVQDGGNGAVELELNNNEDELLAAEEKIARRMTGR